MIEEIVGLNGDKPMVLSTKGSVGASGNNWFEEVKLVQSLLNNVPAERGGPQRKLAVDASAGPLTIAAIKRFQQANGCIVDGRVDARGNTIRELVKAQIASGKPLPPFAGLRGATAEDVTPAKSALALSNLKPATRSLFIAPSQSTTSGLNAIRGSSGFGAPGTSAGWTIDNSVGSFDASFKDTGVYAARMEIFRNDQPTDRFKLSMVGGFKSISIKDGPPTGFDVALPSFAATQGHLIRGISGFAPIRPASFFGICGFIFAGGNLPFTIPGQPSGASAIILMFQWVPAGIPVFVTATGMVGLQLGHPGVGAGAGTAMAVPI